jgi:hypothetical protein
MQILPKRIRPLEISQLRLAIWLSVLIRLIHPADVLSQDILAQHRIAALKGLSEISIILRPNAQSEVLSVREVGDYLEVTVRRRLPELRISPNSASVPAWLELSYVSTDRGATLELRMYRWATLVASKKDVFVPVWSDFRGIFGSYDKKTFPGNCRYSCGKFRPFDGRSLYRPARARS